jgi:hypothetical protein
MGKYFFIVVFISFGYHQLNAQNEEPVIDIDWWRKLVNWDGVTHWNKYYTYSARMMGPNALPVPEMMNGKIDKRNYIGLGGQTHFSDGDNTQNLTMRFNYNFKDVVSVGLFLVPVEFFQMSHQMKEERKVYYEYYHVNSAVGDLYVNTNIQLVTEETFYFDAALRIGLKTASSGLLTPARFTDAPGYYFDVSMGKSLNAGSDIGIKFYGLAGIYVWQTNEDGRPQNDAFLYGLGYDIEYNSIKLSNHLTGYHGYMNNGDSPLVLRFNLQKDYQRFFTQFNYQYGFRDFNYSSYEARIGYKF